MPGGGCTATSRRQGPVSQGTTLTRLWEWRKAFLSTPSLGPVCCVPAPGPSTSRIRARYPITNQFLGNQGA